MKFFDYTILTLFTHFVYAMYSFLYLKFSTRVVNIKKKNFFLRKLKKVNNNLNKKYGNVL